LNISFPIDFFVKKLFVLLSLLLPLRLMLLAQDGQLLDQKTVPVPDSVLEQTNRINPAYKEALEKTDVQEITYLSDGLRVKGYLITPKKSGPYPCVIYNRGGNRDYSAITLSNQVPILARIASWGYVVVASQYRGNGGSEGQEDFGGKDVNDVLNLIPLLASHEKADTSRIGMYGWSRGGMMTYLALTKTDKIKGAIIGAAPVGLVRDLERRPAMGKYVFAPLILNYEKTGSGNRKPGRPSTGRSKSAKLRPCCFFRAAPTGELHPKMPSPWLTNCTRATTLFDSYFSKGAITA
jgi:pimeloyl-ACP methyl ester carboxylesterase